MTSKTANPDKEPNICRVLADAPPPDNDPGIPTATPAENQRWQRRADGATREAEADALTAAWLANNEPIHGHEAPRPGPAPYKAPRKLTPRQLESGPTAGVATSELKPRCQASLDRTPAEVAALIEGQRTLRAGIVDKATGNGGSDMRRDLDAACCAELAAAEREFDQSRNPYVAYDPLHGRHGGFTSFVTKRLKGAVQLERSLHIGPVNGRFGAVNLDAPLADDEDEESTLGAQLAVDADGIARLLDAARGAMPDLFVGDTSGPSKLERMQAAFSTLTAKQQEALAARHDGGEKQMLAVVAADMGISETVAASHVRKSDAALAQIDWLAISSNLAAEKRAQWADRLGLPDTDWRVQDNAVATDHDLREAEWLAEERAAYAHARASMPSRQYNVRSTACVASGLMAYGISPDTQAHAIVSAASALVGATPCLLPARPHRTELAVPALVDGLLCGHTLEHWAKACTPLQLRRAGRKNPVARLIRRAGLVGVVQAIQRMPKVKRAKSKTRPIGAVLLFPARLVTAPTSAPPAWACSVALHGLSTIRPTFGGMALAA